MHKTQNKYLIRPPLFSNIDMWNQYGEKFSGLVLTYHGRHSNSFKIQEHETQADIWVDLRRLNYWEFTDGKTKILHQIPDGTPSPQASQAAIYLQDYELM